jgi:tRNA(Ile)-lysidine synthase TilS/MesJ
MEYVIISLSGGVDSMVISKILAKLAPIMNFKVISWNTFPALRS